MPRSAILRSRRLTNLLTAAVVALISVLSTPEAHGQGGLDLHTVVKTALGRNVAILESRETTRIRAAELDIAEGAFDLVFGFTAEGSRTSRLFSGAEQSIYNVPSAYTGVSTYSLAAARLTRSGITVSPRLEFARQDALTLRVPPVARTQAALEISYPLLNIGRRSPQSADAASAEYALEASKFNERHTRSLSIYRAAVAYWALAGAFESLAILTDSEEKANRLLGETRALVNGGERAASDLDQLRADLADRFAARVSAEQRLFEARQQLGIEMGLSADEAAGLPPPSSGFPGTSGLIPVNTTSDLESLARSRRADLAGIDRSVDAADAARSARSIETRPRLDVRFSIGYAGLTEDRLSLGQHLPPFGQNQVNGTNTSLSLVLEWPTSNARARGLLERQEAFWRQVQIAQADLARRIKSGLSVASKQLRTSAAELAKIEEAVALYEAAVENERKKLQLGMSTQFDLILVEERLRNSQLARVSAQVRYAGAIARLRFETGTLVAEPASLEEIVNVLLSPIID